MLDRVTITGADESTSITEMQELSGEFPFVEWGILVSKSREGGPRYPGREWCDSLSAVAFDDDLMRISMHVCCSWARKFFSGEEYWSELPAVRSVADRMQVNGAPVDVSNMSGLHSARYKRQLILQSPRADLYLARVRELGYSAVPLFDESGGEGIIRSEWPEPLPGIYSGYAGGLGPDNVEAELEKIREKCKQAFWIDMEGRVRTDDKLDLAKVRKVLKICKAFVAVVGA